MATTRIRKGDRVKVIAGRERGKIGNVLRVTDNGEKVIVENLNKIKRHQKPGGQVRQGGIIEREAPIHVSNVMFMCGKCVSPVRVKHTKLEDGKKVRVCGKCQEILDK
ncbi:MAG: 50S ribosomal protein L24 [Deltaproteobacteria bacterium]|nr:50S ribosomal protein L24 [Deltaproteobacteria bacterium]